MSHNFKVVLIHPDPREKKVVLTSEVGVIPAWQFPGGKTDKDQPILAHLKEKYGWRLETLGINLPKSLDFIREMTVSHPNGSVNVALYSATLPQGNYTLSAQNAAFLTRNQILERERVVYPLTRIITDALAEEGKI